MVNLSKSSALGATLPDARTQRRHLGAANSASLMRLNQFQRDSHCMMQTIGWSSATAHMGSFSFLDWGRRRQAPHSKRWLAILSHLVWLKRLKEGPRSGSPHA